MTDQNKKLQLLTINLHLKVPVHALPNETVKTTQELFATKGFAEFLLDEILQEGDIDMYRLTKLTPALLQNNSPYDVPFLADPRPENTLEKIMAREAIEEKKEQLLLMETRLQDQQSALDKLRGELASLQVAARSTTGSVR